MVKFVNFCSFLLVQCILQVNSFATLLTRDYCDREIEIGVLMMGKKVSFFYILQVQHENTNHTLLFIL
jgi:hypothetical protein